ncbi:TPA: divalent-cation tolerance protein CutA [Candidatus Gastranaerophilales bacterium HUM_6]|nr:divalent-cation tolerance protein CutA [bacterium]DAA90232.1 MAG TPA: divalent-cation tolerance protein CutA [Candidatus Gastranaerophilales bacterium HUM_6]DAA95113.1 MAG TPA: divalent-cation tolerance protein CutA [Candidatus Gastranaerophilales bacterium HUM_7]DAB02662.1 MAG TPA: divalent-cation tolerance protein CutA [Candidatus Gastranaerophilales bacterium HUM_12]DAB06275.1 MAG TPA: divalent-cation tolerance protein CutA [Candidatus Gastranaerophilales bacterium HUM_14]
MYVKSCIIFLQIILKEFCMLEYRIVLCTIDSIKNANELAHNLVKARLAACVNIVSGVTSVYEWENAICEENEYLLIIKTKSDLYKKLETKIKEFHPYEVPEIVSLKIDNGSKSYLDWIEKNTL